MGTKIAFNQIEGAAVSVKDFGAVGDGIVDDTSAIEAAITAAISAGQPLYMPSGSYLLSTWTTETITAPLTIIGDGVDKVTITGTALVDFLNDDSTHLEISGVHFDTWQYVINPLDPAGAGKTYRIFNTKQTNIDGFINTPESTCVFDNFYLCENIADTVAEIWCNMSLSAGVLSSAVIRNNILTNVGTTSSANGIAIRLGNDNMTLGDNYIVTGNSIKTVRAAAANTCKAILILNGKKVVIEGNTIEDVQNASASETNCIYVKAEDDSSTTISNNVCRDGSIGSQGSIAVKGGAGDVSITGNSIAFPSHATITGDKNGISLSPKARKVSVAGNIISDADTAIIANSSCVISGNTFRNIRGVKTIALFKTDTIPLNAVISGNLVDGSGLDYTGSNSYALCSIENSVGTAQTDLTATVTGNHTVNPGGTVTNKYAVWLRANSAIGPVIVSNNTFEGVTKILDLDGASNNVPQLSLTGNVVPAATGIGWKAGIDPDNALVKDNMGCDEYDYAVTSTNLNDISHRINTVGKFEGRMVFNSTVNKPVYAAGAAAGNTWNDAQNSVVNTPV